MLDRSPRKRGSTRDAEQTLVDMEHEAVARWMWQKKEQKKRGRKLNKQHKKFLQEQAAKKLAAEQKALHSPHEEEEYDGAYVKEEPGTEMDAEVEPPGAGPFNFVDPGEFHDLKQEPQADQEDSSEPMSQANCDNNPVQAEPGSNAHEEDALDAKGTEHLQDHPQTHAGCKRKARENKEGQKTENKPKKKKSPCPVCSRELVSQHMKRHMCSHTDERPYHCTVCAKSFRRKQHLQDHMRSHTGQRPFSCTVCSKSFRLEHRLQYHLRLHTGERPFECDECGKRFVEKSTLRSHKASIHSGERPHKCDECSAHFVRRWELTMHSKVHMGDVPIFSCKTCGRAFSRDGARMNHSKKCQADVWV